MNREHTSETRDAIYGAASTVGYGAGVYGLSTGAVLLGGAGIVLGLALHAVAVIREVTNDGTTVE